MEGNVIASSEMTNENGILDARPPINEEWQIQNVDFYTDSTSEILIEWILVTESDQNVFNTDSLNSQEDTSLLSRQGMNIDVTNSQWLRIRSTPSDYPVYITYFGVKTKE